MDWGIFATSDEILARLTDGDLEILDVLVFSFGNIFEVEESRQKASKVVRCLLAKRINRDRDLAAQLVADMTRSCARKKRHDFIHMAHDVLTLSKRLQIRSTRNLEKKHERYRKAKELVKERYQHLPKDQLVLAKRRDLYNLIKPDLDTLGINLANSEALAETDSDPLAATPVT